MKIILLLLQTAKGSQSMPFYAQGYFKSTTDKAQFLGINAQTIIVTI